MRWGRGGGGEEVVLILCLRMFCVGLLRTGRGGREGGGGYGRIWEDVVE